MTQAFIHALAGVQATAIGAGTRIWQFVNVLPRAMIGADRNICLHCRIESGAVIGDHVTAKCGMQLMGDFPAWAAHSRPRHDRLGEKDTR